MVTPVSGDKPLLTINGHPVAFHPSSDNSDVGAVEYSPNPIRITKWTPDDLEVFVDGEKLETERYGYWTWYPRGFAGIYELTVRSRSQGTKTALVRVLPSRLTMERWERMLEDIRTVSEDLLFQLQSPAYERAKPRSRTSESSALRDYYLIKNIQPQLAAVIMNIRRNPHRQLIERNQTVLAHNVRQFSSDIAAVPGPLMELTNLSSKVQIARLPQSWIVSEQVLSYDTYENRLLKHFLWRQLFPRIVQIQEKASSELKRREQSRRDKICQGWEEDETRKIEALTEVVRDCQSMSNQCIVWGSEGFLLNVGNMHFPQQPTQVLQKNPFYNRFYRIYLGFQKELGYFIDTETFIARLATRKVSELYETWAVFIMTSVVMKLLLKSGYRVISSNGFYEVNNNQFQIDVDRQANIELSKDNKIVRIRYEPLYPQSGSVSRGAVSIAQRRRTPDLSIETWLNNECKGIILFDAKYKTRREANNLSYYDDDLNKMSDYIYAIRWKTPEQRTRPVQIVKSAYILYPGNVLEHDSQFPERGALPFIPNNPYAKNVVRSINDILGWSNLK
jgi:hypothetical protein